jgi:ribosomal 50S subunit-associated protein YjgA (DUF615 family)
MKEKSEKKHLIEKERTVSSFSFLGKKIREKNLRKNQIYGNCKVYSPSGNLMFLCVEKKANWYLNRVDDETGNPIAKEIRHINPIINFLMTLFFIKPNGKRVQLLFEPKNEGNLGDKYSLAQKENRCVITGSYELELLTKHHITPYCYRTHLPDIYKSANSHDVVPIIGEKHYEYERDADNLKKQIAKEYNAPLEGKVEIDFKLFYAIKSSVAIKNHGDKMPKDILEVHKNKIRDYTCKKAVTQKIVDTLSSKSYEEAKKVKSHGELVVEKLIERGPDAIQEFVEMWRKHFVEHAKPKYMPKHWSIKRKASRI